MTSSKARSVSATLLFTFLRLWVSLALRNTAASSMPPANARSRPRALGTRAENVTSAGFSTMRQT
jgi:hypothetical protein